MRHFYIFVLSLFFCQVSTSQNTQLQYELIDSTTLMVTADTLYPNEEIRVEWFTDDSHGFFGYMDFDTMYFDIPYQMQEQDSFLVRSRKFVDVQHNDHFHTYWSWLHDFVTVKFNSDSTPQVVIEPHYNSYTDILTVPDGNLIVIKDNQYIVIDEYLIESENSLELNLYQYGTGTYYIIFWNNQVQQTWTVQVI